MAESLFTTQTPTGANNADGTPGINTATSVMFAVTGSVTGIRFYATTTVSGTYTAALYRIATDDGSSTGTGVLLASKVMGAAPTGGAWNTVTFDTPVTVDTTHAYRAVIHSSAGRYVNTSAFFTSAALVNGNITGIRNGTDPAAVGSIYNGTFEINAALTYPTDTSGESSYFVDVVFEGDTPAAPPWVDHASGVAARNGTTSHTIPFGFTSTTGNMLVFVVFAAVTHSAGGGWTERLQPVATGELSVFTKTSTGDSSITVTHNGSNLPACWSVYELPAGATWTAGVGDSTATNDTFPTLSALPGTEQVVWAARGRAANSINASAASSTWTAPWVEDADQFAAHDGATSGAYLTIGHRPNVTATSVTPAAASTYTGPDFAAEREQVVFAMSVPVADTVAPSVPTGLAVTAVGSTTADLTWLASTDNVGVTAYEVVIVGP